MAVTTEGSVEYGYETSTPPTIQEANVSYGKLRALKFTFTQGGSAGDANSYARLRKLPPGKITIMTGLSYVEHSAFGSDRTLDVGYEAYTAPDGTAVVADEDALHSAQAVASAGNFNPTDEVAGRMLTLNSRDGIVISAKCEGGTLPAAATLKGYLVVLVE